MNERERELERERERKREGERERETYKKTDRNPATVVFPYQSHRRLHLFSSCFSQCDLTA